MVDRLAARSGPHLVKPFQQLVYFIMKFRTTRARGRQQAQYSFILFSFLVLVTQDNHVLDNKNGSIAIKSRSGFDQIKEQYVNTLSQNMHSVVRTACSISSTRSCKLVVESSL